MRSAGFTLTVDEMLTVIDHVVNPVNTPIIVNDVPVDGAEYVDGRINLIQERTNVVPSNAVINVIEDIRSATRSKRVAEILDNFNEEWGLP